MLILTRRVGEFIDVNLPPELNLPGFKIAIVSVDGNNVRVGVDAPREYKVSRDDDTRLPPKPVNGNR